MQPAALVTKLPTITTTNSPSGGQPRLANHRAHRAGTIKINRPVGLSQRIKRRMVFQIGSGEGRGAVSIDKIQWHPGISALTSA
jgi:hypothetical protein